MNREHLRTWVSLVAEVTLPLFCLRAWLAPDGQSNDATASLLAALAGENLVLIAMLILPPLAQWKFREWFGVLAYGGIVLFFICGAFAVGWYATSLAGLLVFGRYVGVAWGNQPHADDFPTDPLQAFVALAVFWALLLLLDFGNQHGIHISSDRGVGDMAAHGTLYFSAILVIRIVRLVNIGRLRLPG